MKDWLNKLNDPKRDPYERRYRLIALVSILSLIVWWFISAVLFFQALRFSFFGIAIILCIILYVYALKTLKIQPVAITSSVGLVFAMLPMAFISNGGINAGAPNWCIIALVFVVSTVKGPIRFFLVAGDFIVTITFFVLNRIKPHMFVTYDERTGFVNSFMSLAITVTLVTSLLLFQTYMFHQERAILEKQRDEIEDLNRMQNRFFSSMSHEIRTPINTIIGMNELVLREKDLPPEAVSRLESVDAASHMLLSLINDVLDVSKMESGKMEIVPVEYDLGAMLYEVADMIGGRANEKGLAFRVNVDDTLPAELYGDEVRIKQVLVNLLSNAVKYTEKGSVTMTVQADRTDAKRVQLTFRVEDTGMGIKKEAIPYLFDAFKRVDEAKNRNIEGTGLGLSIVKQIVDLMEGEINVTSVYTKGSTFTFALSQEVIGDKTLKARDLWPREASNSRARYRQSFEAPGTRVLIVDDNEMNLQVETGLLKETKMTIDTALSGAQALEKTISTRYDVIFMDHLMPEMDGIECLKRIREQEGGLNREAPVIALTANAGSENQALYAASGFDGYLLKPVSGVQLEGALLRALPQDKITLTGTTVMQGDSDAMFGHAGRKKNVQISMDSGCDLPKWITDRYEIAVINHRIHTDKGTFRDNMETDSGELILYLEDPSHTATSSAPDVEQHEQFFGLLRARAQHVIHFTLGINASNGVVFAKEAAASFDNVTVVDTRNISSTAGMMVLYAAYLATKNNSYEEIMKKVRLALPTFHTSFMMDSAAMFARSGRVKHYVHTLTDAFLLHPTMEVKNGVITTSFLPFGRYRERYIRRTLNKYRKADYDTSLLFISYAGMSERELEAVKTEINRIMHFDRVIFQPTSSAIAVNTGPGTFGLMFRTRGNDRDTGPDMFGFLPLQEAEEKDEEESLPDSLQDAGMPGTESVRAPVQTAVASAYDGPSGGAVPDEAGGSSSGDTVLPVDEEVAVRHCGSREVFDSAMRMFAESAMAKAGEIEQYFLAEDWENYTIKVHALKSSARLIGAIPLSKAAEHLEAMGNAAKES